ncbi:MAG: YicC family protein [Chitinophagales bacterium]|jgi:uncharacterized protein (TIGR00255 family)|nr:YicC family protein [Chitinophagales bacterium]
MLYSMTGYGRSEQSIGDKVLLVELRSLNGKQFDLRLNIPAQLKPFEFDIRQMLSESLERGSVECIATIKNNGASKPVAINTDLLKSYYTSVKQVAEEMQADDSQLLAAILRLPEVVTNQSELLNDEEWAAAQRVFQDAITQINTHRTEEGKVLEADLLDRVQQIEQLQAEIATLEPLRREKIREGLKKTLEENVGKENYDPNRLEQELIYYIEKIDISEEQVRLKNHCDYFREVLKGKERSKGKKLSFVLQEFGREINTTGSKAYDATIQKCVILMKDELEKAKEQVLNIL